MPVFLPFWKTNSKKAEGIALLLAGLFFTIISILYSVNDLVFFSNADKFNAIVIENIERINSDKQVEYIIKVRFFDHNKTEKIKILKEKSLTEPQFMINEKISIYYWDYTESVRLKPEYLSYIGLFSLLFLGISVFFYGLKKTTKHWKEKILWEYEIVHRTNGFD